MIRRILGALLVFLFIALIITWLLGGGIANIKAAVNHYRDPLKYGSVFNWFFQIGSTTGESFHLPGTPSNYPTVSIPTSTATTTSRGPTIIYTPGSNGGQGIQ
jgi:hypothetical protein